MLLVFFFALGGYADALRAAMVDKIVAVVNDEPITQSDLDEVFGPIYMDLREHYEGDVLLQKLEEARLASLNQLIEEALIYKEVEKQKEEEEKEKTGRPVIEVTEGEIDEMIKRFKGQFASEAEMARALEMRGLTMQRLRESYKRRIAVRKMNNFKIRARIMISPQAIQKYYEEHPEKFTKAGHWILSSITIKKPEENIQQGTKSEEKYALAESVYERLVKGESFQNLAKAFSEDAFAKAGGEMGPVREGELVSVIEEAVKKLDVGGVTDIVETEVGYHIFRLDDRVVTEHPSLPEVREEIGDLLYHEEFERRYHEWMNELKKNAYIRVM